MILDNRYTIMMSVGLALALLAGCGSGASDTKGSGKSSVAGDDNNTQSNENNNTGTTDNSTTSNAGTGVPSYTAGNGVLYETKSDGKKLVWVNSLEDALCKISRPENRSGTVYADGVAHCQSLTHAGITSWRLPTVAETQSLMQHENKSILPYPSSNPDCAILTTNVENTFVHTTSAWNDEAKNWGQSYVDFDRNNKTAGIRCVADQ